MNKEENIKVPVYALLPEEVQEGKEPTSPIHRTLSKTMEVTETFNIYDTMVYIAKMKKAAADKRAEADGLDTMVEAFEKELMVIEEQLGIQGLEEQFQKEYADNLLKTNGENNK